MYHCCTIVSLDILDTTFTYMHASSGIRRVIVIVSSLQARPRLPRAEVEGAAAAFPLSRAPCIESYGLVHANPTSQAYIHIHWSKHVWYQDPGPRQAGH